MDKIKKGDSKPRWYDKKETDFDPHVCADSGGCYQELPTLGAFAECVPGTREQRLADNNYCKENLKTSREDAGLVIKPDTNGPPFLNISFAASCAVTGYSEVAHDSETKLLQEAYMLSKTNVEQWQRYLAALDEYTWYIVERATRAPTTELHVVMGMARQALEFNANMKALDEAFDKLKNVKR